MSSHSVGFADLASSLDRIGFVEVLLPFLLIFTVIYAILDKTKIMGEGKRNMNVAIGFIFALLVVVPHVTGNLPAGYDPVLIINAALPSVSLVVIAVLALMILIGVFAHDRILLGMTAPGWVGLFSIVVLVFIFGSAAGWWDSGVMNWLENLFGTDVVAVLIMLLVFGIIIAFVTGGGEHEKVGALEKAGINLKNLFGGAAANEKMATFLDVTTLGNFSIIFVFLLAWLGGYAVLLYFKILGNNQFLNIILSLIFAFFVIISPLATLIFETIAPIAAVVMMLVMIVYFASSMFGNTNIESLTSMKYIMLVILVIGLVVGSATIIRQQIDVPERGEDFSKTSTVIFHPNFLGMILIFAVAVFTIGLLAAKQM